MICFSELTAHLPRRKHKISRVNDVHESVPLSKLFLNSIEPPHALNAASRDRIPLQSRQK